MIKGWKRIFDWVVNILFWGCMGLVLFICLQVLLFSSFKIPSHSMEPGLIDGDNVLVIKTVPGARIFNIFRTLDGERVPVRRLPGIRKVKQGDVIVFNFPCPKNWDQIEMDLMLYYIKRCIGMPGDTVEIRNGYYRVNGTEGIGQLVSQKRISNTPDHLFEPGVFNTFPYDSVMGWTIKEFGPLYIPAKGETILMSPLHYTLYKKVIEWEQEGALERDGNDYLIDGEKIDTYTFKHNYYFAGGDLGEDSQDSRYWGLLPEEFIVGRAAYIWRSKDRYTGKFRWKRFMKRIH